MYPCCQKAHDDGTLVLKRVCINATSDGQGNITVQSTDIVRVCPECKRRHFEMEAEPGVFSLKGF